MREIVRSPPADEGASRRLSTITTVVPFLDATLLEEALAQILAAPDDQAEALAAWCDRRAALGDATRALEVARDVHDPSHAQAH